MTDKKPRGWVRPLRGPPTRLDYLRWRIIKWLAGSDFVLLNADCARATLHVNGNQRGYADRARDLTIRVDNEKPVWWLGPSHD